MRAAQHLEQGLCFFHRIHANPVVMSINNSWDIDSVSFMGNHAPHVVIRIEQNLENVFASNGGDIRPPDVIEVMRVIQQLELRLCS